MGIQLRIFHGGDIVTDYLLSIDIGTSACKVVIFDLQGQVIARDRKSVV